MPSAPTRAVLFLSSYAPLFVVLAIRGLHAAWLPLTVAGVLFAVAVGSVLVLRQWVRIARRLTPAPVVLKRASPRDDLAVAYIVTYILPFLGIDFSKWRDVLALSLVFAVTLFVAVRTNLFYVNPMLNLMGYHIHEVEDEAGNTFALLSERSFVKLDTVASLVALDRHGYVTMERI
jgi:hypothetical protein